MPATRPDPWQEGLRTRTVDRERPRVSASHLRGFYLPRQAVFWTAFARATASQAIPGSSWTTIALDTTDKDAGADDADGDTGEALVDLANEKLILRHAGVYLLMGNWRSASDGGGSFRHSRFLLNDTTVLHQTTMPYNSGGVGQDCPIFFPYVSVDADDEIKLQAFQDGVGTTSITGDNVPYLAAAWMGL